MGSDFIGIILVLAAIGVFFLCRELMCWYWKINQHLENQEKIIFLLQKLVKKSNSIESSQVDINDDLVNTLGGQVGETEKQIKANNKSNDSKMVYGLYGVIIIGIIVAYLLLGK